MFMLESQVYLNMHRANHVEVDFLRFWKTLPFTSGGNCRTVLHLFLGTNYGIYLPGSYQWLYTYLIGGRVGSRNTTIPVGMVRYHAKVKGVRSNSDGKSA